MVSLNWLCLIIRLGFFAVSSHILSPAYANAEEVMVDTKPAPSVGTAFYVTSDGYLITANHILKEKREIFVREIGQNQWKKAKIIKTDSDNDLALLKVEGVSIPLTLADWDAVPIGLEAYVVGFPMPSIQGRGIKITAGLYNGDVENRFRKNYFQLSSEVQKGNSGGPVLSPDLLVIGMVQSKLNAIAIAQKTKDLPQNVNFALKSQLIVQFLDNTPVKLKVSKPNLDINNRPFEVLRDVSRSILMVRAFSNQDLLFDSVKPENNNSLNISVN